MRLYHLGLVAAFTSAQLYEQFIDQEQQYGTPCSLLAATFPGQVHTPPDDAYALSQSSYWSVQQSELKPSCRFYPREGRDVQIALADIILPNNVSIAVSSGGHSSVEGASNIHGGVTIDLSSISGMMVVDEGKALYLGPGARWKDVYANLGSQNLTVSGGRVGHVGVGGYLLGGGFSWFANQHGWTCDSVLEFEVVTPQAEILGVDAHHHEDLFWAMKGSLGAFGIVTKIKMSTIPKEPVYGGALGYNQNYILGLCGALQKLNVQASKDLATQGYLSFAWIEARKAFTYSAYLMNTNGTTWNDALSAFKVIPHEGNLRPLTIGESSEEIDDSNPLGLRRSKFTLTAKSSVKAMMALHQLVKAFAETGKINFDNESLLGVTFQPLTIPHIQAQSSFFNLGTANGPLILVSVEFWWSDAGKDSYFHDNAKHLRELMEAELKKLDAAHPFIYPNYAAKEQSPFESLTSSSKRMLEEIRRKYDPDNLWQMHVPGIWHV